MLVGNTLRVRAGAIHLRRGLLIALLAAALIWFLDGYVSMAPSGRMFAVLVVLVAGALTAMLLAIPVRAVRVAHTG